MTDIKDLKWWQRILVKIASKKLNKMATKATKSSSNNTTLAGIGMILVAIGTGLKLYFDGDPSTTVDFSLIIAEVVAAIGLFTAKDANASHTVED